MLTSGLYVQSVSWSRHPVRRSIVYNYYTKHISSDNYNCSLEMDSICHLSSVIILTCRPIVASLYKKSIFTTICLHSTRIRSKSSSWFKGRDLAWLTIQSDGCLKYLSNEKRWSNSVRTPWPVSYHESYKKFTDVKTRKLCKKYGSPTCTSSNTRLVL